MLTAVTNYFGSIPSIFADSDVALIEFAKGVSITTAFATCAAIFFTLRVIYRIFFGK